MSKNEQNCVRRPEKFANLIQYYEPISNKISCSYRIAYDRLRAALVSMLFPIKSLIETALPMISNESSLKFLCGLFRDLTQSEKQATYHFDQGFPYKTDPTLF